jgi:HTH domain
MTHAINPEGASRPDRDRRLRQADRLGRILNVLRLIQSRGKWNAKSIASELEVTERTVVTHQPGEQIFSGSCGSWPVSPRASNALRVSVKGSSPRDLNVR